MSDVCICGRSWNHCKICGSRSVYCLLTESSIETAKQGFAVAVYRCKKCMNATSDLVRCQAGLNKEVRDFTTKAKAEAELSKLPLRARLQKMIEDGATMEEVTAVIEAAGLKVEIQEEDVQSKPLMKEKPLEKQEEVPEGWSRNSEGQLVPPLSVDELIDRVTKKKDGE